MGQRFGDAREPTRPQVHDATRRVGVEGEIASLELSRNPLQLLEGGVPISGRGLHPTGPGGNEASVERLDKSAGTPRGEPLTVQQWLARSTGTRATCCGFATVRADAVETGAASAHDARRGSHIANSLRARRQPARRRRAAGRSERVTSSRARFRGAGLRLRRDPECADGARRRTRGPVPRSARSRSSNQVGSTVAR
jgi:hypothetical protein